MTSVGVISSAVARIECLKELLKLPESLSREAEELRKGLEEIKNTLIKAQEEEFGELEKKIVRLSYDIVDAIVDASPKSKETFSVSKLTHRKKSENTKLKELQTELIGFQKELNSSSSRSEKAGPEQRAESSSSTASEIQEDKPKKKMSVTEFFKSKLERKRSSQSIQGDHPKKMIDSETQEKGDDEQMKPKGRDDLFKEITTDLKNPSSEYSVVYIVGESGMGKTTFTRELFQDLKHSFDALAWVPINHNFQIKTVLRFLLQKLGPSQDLDIRDMNEMQLISHIFAALQKKKNNLLVLDDIAALDDWESIRLALPVGNSTKVIVTTTNSKDFRKKKNLYQITGLSEQEILDLLGNEASSITEEVGKAISDISGGSPLFATILGISLQQSAAGDHQLVINELRSYESQKGKPQVLGVCYKRLAHECKPCLLYLGQFPQGQDIEVEKLYLLLMAENLIISPKEESKTSLQSLEGYLKKLADRKLVQVQEGTLSRGRTHKSCRLHDQVREFCKFKGSKEEFFEIVDLGSRPPKKIGLHTRRLAIYLSKYRADESIQFESQETVQKIESIQFESQETVQKILSLLIFDTFESAAERKSEWPSDINDLKEFKNLRILNFDGVDFKVRKVPRGMDRLVLLRYLSFRGCRLGELPSSMSNLTQLETLDLVVHEDCKMVIPSNILTNMKRMVHLYLPRQYESNRKTKLQLHGLERLELLINFDMDVCDFQSLSEFTNLKILSTISKGNTEDFDKIINLMTEQAKARRLHYLSVDITSFDCYNRESVSSLKKLLECQFVHSIHIEGRIGKLPDRLDSPAGKVAEIFLNGSEIEDDPMNYLGTKFQNLQSLVLSNDAFLGSEIVISAAAAEFRNLRSLKLLNLQYLERLTIKQGAMPKLSTLLIDNRHCLGELSIPKAMHDRLKKAEGEDEGVTFMVMPSPAKLNITTSDQVPSTSGSRKS
ncbi:hypothetical protein C2S53_011759 [Perilla frutescens var. hirtella]|uniref:AAA+ ATPase domain-containing protein n=1 Tax=Perilla frutescens var. hirtella TaxID=608512 RepID=A0AAD4J8Z7_PERFH|nr:hypothetical protein C2S53_011759 [Perilla frutescens var. hirtella]